MEHYSTRDPAHYQKKLDCYIPLEIKIMQDQRKSRGFWRPFLIPPAKFIYFYIFRGGFLDGWAGLQYAVLSSYYDFLKQWRYNFNESEKASA